MPSKNPRLSVVLPPSLAATLAALSQATGESASSLVRGLLEQAEPALQRMLQLVTAAALAKGKIGAGVGESLDRVVSDLEQAIAHADTWAGHAVHDLVNQAEAVPARRRRPGGPAARAAPAGGPTPGPVTRGSGTGKTRGGGGRKGGRHGSL